MFASYLLKVAKGFSMDTTKKTYSHREAAKLLNISYHTLLRWIVDGKVADVMRERNGYRVFTDADIQRIKSFSETVSLPPVNHYITDEEPCGYSVASFFSGIGGFDLGFQQAGFDVNFQCEVEPFCLDVLQQHWPKVAKWSDITTLDHATVPFSTYGSEVSRVKTFLLREWAKEKDLEDQNLNYFMSLLDWLERESPEFLLSKTLRVYSTLMVEETLPFCSTRWPNSGMLLDGVLLTADTSESPSQGKESTLSDVIEIGEVPERYFLSPNAARGILRRANRMGRNLRPHFKKSLEILAETDQ
jgi:DNA (cytosine-5)-methyltransferase 1